MKTQLVVTEPFAKRMKDGEAKRQFGRGETITDAADIKAVLDTHRGYVVRAAAEPEEGDPNFADATAEARKEAKAAPAPASPAEPDQPKAKS